MFETVAQKRFRQLEELNSAPFGSPAKPPPKVTYGKRNKPLPLRGTHFLRQDTYSIPPDDDSDDEEDFVPIRVGKPRPKKAKEPDPDDSPLSEDELNAAYASNASPILSPSSSPVLPTSSSKTSLDPERGTLSAKNGIGRPVHQPARKAVHPPEKRTAVKERPRAKPKGSQGTTANSDSTAQIKRTKIRPKAKGTIAAKPKAAVVTRLPVNELLSVPEPRDRPPTTAAKKVDADHDDLDPISNATSSSQKRALPPHHNDSDNQAKAPLTTIRKRLKTPKLTHKSIADLRKRQSRRSTIFQSNDETSKLGDGFESCELKVDHCHIFAKRQRKAFKPLELGFRALQLQSGPLPDVKFESSSSELKLKGALEDQSFPLVAVDQYCDEEDRDQSFAREAKRRVSFSDRVLSDMVRQELSSISAPRKPISISSDQSESDFQEFDKSDEEVNEDEASDGGAESDAQSEPPAPTPPSNQRAVSQKRFLRTSTSPRRLSEAEAPTRSLDRHIGQAPRALSSRPRVMEVDDAILDDPGDALPTSRTLLRNDNLIEVDEMILDDFESQASLPAAQGPIWDREHDMLDEMEGSIYARSYNELPPPRPLRPRSILRNPSSRFESRATRAEDTAANTRRNSTRQIEAESRHFPQPSVTRRRTTAIDLEDQDQSRYFSTAANSLQHPQPSSDQPQMIKMRSNYFARQASQRGEVQVYDSKAQVQETSPEPEPPDYTNSTSSQLKILRKGADATWTSSESLPRETKDLKALTRSVSREYGTLSQSVRRKPSLPFHSPTKIR